MDLDAPVREVFADLPRILLAELGEEHALELAEKEPGSLDAVIYDVVRDSTETVGLEMAERLKADGPVMLARRPAANRAFRRGLGRRWARPFDLAEMAMVVAYEVGEAFNEQHRARAEADNDLTFVVLVRLHARACRIAEEVLTLLKAGFGQAALARWRALHESPSSHRSSVSTARRPQSATCFTSTWRTGGPCRSSRPERNDSTKSRWPTRSCTKRKTLSRSSSRATARSTRDHTAGRTRPWSRTMKGTRKERISFSAIEQAVSLDHMRPYYRMASHGTHANPKGILFTPDMLDGEPEVLLAGPGATGFADPGQCALISLNLVTATLMASRTAEAAPLVLTALKQLVDEAATAYVETERKVDRCEDMQRYGPVARFRYHAVPSLAAKRQRAWRFVASAASRARRTAAPFSGT